MKVKGFWCGLLVCLLGLNAFGAGEVSSFVQKNLDFDLKNVTFGIQLKDHPEYTKVSDAFGYPGEFTNLVWYVNSVSAAYGKDHPERSIWFGFENGRLAAVKFGRSGMNLDGKHPQWHEQAVAAHKTFRSLPKGKGWMRDDGQFQAGYSSMCNDSEDIYAHIYIKPSASP